MKVLINISGDFKGFKVTACIGGGYVDNDGKVSVDNLGKDECLVNMHSCKNIFINLARSNTGEHFLWLKTNSIFADERNIKCNSPVTITRDFYLYQWIAFPFVRAYIKLFK